ncbi:aspartate aminotransferase family protein [Denitrobaculum tricleocarpae]|uniref:Acetylornithine aminotransferase n=1 Tax=Denitrobaculum tricleocarpae TaxID=2591009 RepID=A0A545T7Y3_9PROT|nr:aspartate aminotransferase family protein [Denitrobaculum tricleocarpae]TQV73344.1 aspartate aminotransferase family protein [Denitrobaculum tricleocarpae]
MSQALMPTYARADLAFERGEGPYLYTADDRRFLDFAAGIAVNSLGHSHPHLVKALTKQGAKLWHVSNLYQIPDGARLAERLAENSFADRVFFSNSGAEAMEGALKLARKYHHARGNPERFRVITCSNAFHGRTMTTLSAAGNPKYLEGFGPEPEGFDHVAFGNMNELRAAITPETAAILVEPVQGEGGIRPASVEYLRALREVCDEYGLLLIFDEIQCGMGRTGRLFAHEWAGITPDVMALAKGIGGGFPMGAFLATEEAASGMQPGSHGSTYGGNPLAMAIGNAVLDVMLEEGFLAKVQKTGDLLKSRLEALVAANPHVFEEVRGTGLILGLKAVPANVEIIAALRDQGLLTVGAAENVIRILPPLIIDEIHVDEALAALERVCASWPETGSDGAA